MADAGHAAAAAWPGKHRQPGSQIILLFGSVEVRWGSAALGETVAAERAVQRLTGQCGPMREGALCG